MAPPSFNSEQDKVAKLAEESAAIIGGCVDLFMLTQDILNQLKNMIVFFFAWMNLDLFTFVLCIVRE